MSIAEGDAIYPAESRIPFADDPVTYWLSRDDVREIEARIKLAQAVIAVVENDPSWLQESLSAQLTIDEKRRYVELATALLGRPRLFGWHRHVEVQTRESAPPNWDQLLAEGRLSEVSRKAHIHRYRVLASARIAESNGGSLQEAVMDGVRQLNRSGADIIVVYRSEEGYADPEPAFGRPARRATAASAFREVEVRRIEERTIVVCLPGEFGPFIETVGRTTDYRRRTADPCCGQTIFELFEEPRAAKEPRSMTERGSLDHST